MSTNLSGKYYQGIFLQFFLYFFFMYMKMYKKLSAKYYQENKERLHTHTQKKRNWCERYQNLPEEEKEKKATIWLWKLQKSLWIWKQ